ncbi:MAG: hypothetical protein ACOH1H_06690 [Brevundimonas sp.]|jgi:hypothetical protein
MLAQIITVYRRIPGVVAALPLVMLLPLMGEGVQHIAEVWLGMFTPGDGLAAGRETTIRLSFGGLKALSVFASIILTARFLDRRPDRAPTTLRQWIVAMNRYDLTGVLVLIAVIAVPFAAHHGLNAFAVGKPLILMALILFADSVVVGTLAVSLGSVAFSLAEKASQAGDR